MKSHASKRIAVLRRSCQGRSERAMDGHRHAAEPLLTHSRRGVNGHTRSANDARPQGIARQFAPDATSGCVSSFPLVGKTRWRDIRTIRTMSKAAGWEGARDAAQIVGTGVASHRVPSRPRPDSAPPWPRDGPIRECTPSRARSRSERRLQRVISRSTTRSRPAPGSPPGRFP
jgi:hypothetical protein